MSEWATLDASYLDPLGSGHMLISLDDDVIHADPLSSFILLGCRLCAASPPAHDAAAAHGPRPRRWSHGLLPWAPQQDGHPHDEHTATAALQLPR
jgi:hypothetical protein